VNKSSARGHKNEMSVEGQLAGLRAIERRNVAIEVAIRAVCAAAVAWALTGSAVAVALAGSVVGLLASRRQRIPSLDELADRIDRARRTHGLVRTALASEGGRANGSPLLVDHAVARADALLRADGRSMVRPFRLPGSALAATAVVCFFFSTPSSLVPSTVVETLPGFHATGVGRDGAASLSEGDDARAVNRRRGTGLADFARFVANGGRSTSGMEGTVADVQGAVGASESEPATKRPEDIDPCPPDVLCTPSGLRNSGSAPSSSGGSNGRAPPSGEGGASRTDAHGDPSRAPPSQGIDQGALGMGTEAARGSPQGNKSDGVLGDGDGGSGEGAAEKASTVAQPPDPKDSADQNGGVNGSGGTNQGLDERSERSEVQIAEERVKGLWQSSAQGTVDAIEDGLAGEQTSVPWRDLHAWYEAIAEDAVAKEGVPVTRRAYVQHYFDTLAPGEAAP
jgi:hypothetical protein